MLGAGCWVLPAVCPALVLTAVLPAAVQSTPRNSAAQAVAYSLIMCMVSMSKGFAGKTARPDLNAVVSSGMFELCVEAVEAFAARGEVGLANTHRGAIICAMANMRNCSGLRECEAQMRSPSMSSALVFCLEHPLVVSTALSFGTGTYAAMICESVCARQWSGAQHGLLSFVLASAALLPYAPMRLDVLLAAF